ncbi:MAG: hypothetical protein AB1465_03045 [Patescibacteria group bacterium]
MKKIIVLFVTAALLLGLSLVMPQEKQTKADYTMPSLVSISTGGQIVTDADGVVNLSNYTSQFPMWDATHLAYAEGWMIQNPNYPVGTEFQVIMDMEMQQPYVAVVQGEVTSWSYDSETGYATINAKSITVPGRNGGPDMHGLIVAVCLGIADPNAPTDQIKGMYVSTNAYDWEMIPPKPGDKSPKFGYEITGKDGLKNGFFKMYMPKALLDFMHIKPKDLAGFIDGDQYAAEVSETPDGGAIISLTLHFSTRKVEAGKALPLSLAASKTTIKKGKRASLFGWLGKKKKGKEVQLYKKEKGEKVWTLFATLKTKKQGYFKKTLALQKTTKFKAKWINKKGKKVTSPVKKVKVK